MKVCICLILILKIKNKRTLVDFHDELEYMLIYLSTHTHTHTSVLNTASTSPAHSHHPSLLHTLLSIYSFAHTHISTHPLTRKYIFTRPSHAHTHYRVSAKRPTSIALSAQFEVAKLRFELYTNLIAGAVKAVVAVVVLSALLCNHMRNQTDKSTNFEELSICRHTKMKTQNTQITRR